MRLFLQLKALGSVNAEDLLRALLAKLPLPPANGSSLAVRIMDSEVVHFHFLIGVFRVPTHLARRWMLHPPGSGW